MAQAVRIDGATLSGGRVEIRYTAGATPLPATWSGQALVADAAGLQATVQEARDRIDVILLATLIFRLARAAGGINASFVSQAAGKGALFDIDGVPAVGQSIMTMGSVT